MVLYGSGGSSTTFSGDDNTRFGLILDYGASGWRLGSVAFSRTGFSERNSSGTAISIAGGNDNSIATATLIGNAGYGLALIADRTGRSSQRNRIGSVTVDGTGSWDSDPGIHLSGGASDNTFDSVTVIGAASGISIGEGFSPATNDRNRFGTVRITGAGYGVLRISGGSGNVFAAVTASASGTPTRGASPRAWSSCWAPRRGATP